MKKLYAANKNLIIQTEEKSEIKSESGIILSANSAGITFDKAKVISVGEDVFTDIKVGDTVIFKSGLGFPLKLEDNDFKVIAAENILAILRD